MQMIRLLCALVLATATLLASGDAESQTTSQKNSADFAFVNVNVVPMDQGLILEKYTVLIKDDLITWLGPANSIELPVALRKVDGTGKYLMPGLVDSHVHLEGGNDLVLYVANGVTAVRNLCGLPQHLQLRKRIVEDAKFVAPTIYTAGPIIDGNPPRWPGSVIATNAEQGRNAVNEQASAGWDFIKVYSRLSVEAYDAIIATAAEKKLSVQGHIPTPVGLFHALAAGQHAIDHFDGYQEAILKPSILSKVSPNQLALRLASGELDWEEIFDSDAMERAVQATIEAGTWNIPTVAIRQLVAPDEYETRVSGPGTQYLSKAELASWKPNAALSSERMRAERRLQHEFSHRLIATLHKAGGKLLVGTDASDPFVLPGFSIHEELEHFVRSGLSPYETLERATRFPAEFMGVADQVGTIAPQKRADLLLLDANPLTDITHIRRLAGVSLRGRWLPASEIAGMLEEVKIRAQLSTSNRKEIEVALAILETYVGTYQLGPGRSFVVTLDDNALFAQMTGRAKTAIYPESETTFFSKPVDGRASLPPDAAVVFTKNESGVVSGIVLQQRGAELPGRRVEGAVQ